MSFDSHPTTGIRRNIVAVSLGTISLFAGAFLVFKASNNSNSVVVTVQDNAGRPRLVQTGSGAQTGSGNLMVANGAVGSGKLLVGGNDGGGLCLADKDGAGYTITDCNNGTCVDRVAGAAECVHP